MSGSRGRQPGKPSEKEIRETARDRHLPAPGRIARRDVGVEDLALGSQQHPRVELQIVPDAGERDRRRRRVPDQARHTVVEQEVRAEKLDTDQPVEGRPVAERQETVRQIPAAERRRVAGSGLERRRRDEPHGAIEAARRRDAGPDEHDAARPDLSPDQRRQRHLQDDLLGGQDPDAPVVEDADAQRPDLEGLLPIAPDQLGLVDLDAEAEVPVVDGGDVGRDAVQRDRTLGQTPRERGQ